MCCPIPDPVALVLGGTRGLGYHIAAELLKNKNVETRPIVVGRSRPEWPDETMRRYVPVIQADLNDPASAEAIVEAAFNGDPEAFYWVAGEYHRGAFAEQDPAKIAHMLATHVTGPLSVLQAFHREAKRRRHPYTLVVIGSVFVHKPGRSHAMLAAAKAFKANFARVFCHELAADLPGSMTLLVNPWAMKTEFFDGYPMDAKAVAGFMDPAEVARIIVDQVENLPRDSKPPMVELTLDRDKDKPGGILKLLGPQPVKY